MGQNLGRDVQKAQTLTFRVHRCCYSAFTLIVIATLTFAAPFRKTPQLMGKFSQVIKNMRTFRWSHDIPSHFLVFSASLQPQQQPLRSSTFRRNSRGVLSTQKNA